MQLGVYTVMVADYPAEETAKMVSEAGYTGIEWTVGYPKALWDANQEWHISETDLEEDAKRVKEISDKHNLKIAALGTRAGCDEFGRIERLFKACGILETRGIRVGTARYDGKTNYNELLKYVVENLKTVEKIARDYNCRALLEIHMGTIIPSASSAYRIASNFDPKYIGVTLDPGNMVHEGFENWQMGVEILGEYLAHVHVKNYGWLRKDGRWVLEPMSLKEGVANYEQIIQALKSVNYQGFLCTEDFRGGYCQVPEGITTQEKLEENYRYLKGLI